MSRAYSRLQCSRSQPNTMALQGVTLETVMPRTCCCLALLSTKQWPGTYWEEERLGRAELDSQRLQPLYLAAQSGGQRHEGGCENDRHDACGVHLPNHSWSGWGI